MPDQEEIKISQLNAEEAGGRVALLERLKDHFWIRWRNEYLLECYMKWSSGLSQKGVRGRIEIRTSLNNVCVARFFDYCRIS